MICKVAAAYVYDDFGYTEVKVRAGFDNEVGYTGQIWDKDTGRYYYNAFLPNALAVLAKRTAKQAKTA